MKGKKKNRRVKEKPPDSSEMQAVTLHRGSNDSKLSESDKFMEKIKLRECQNCFGID